MSLTYTYNIIDLTIQNDTVNNLQDVVVHVRWTCTGTDANNTTGTFSGATPFEAVANNFTPYANLTLAQVTGWVTDVVNSNPGYQQHIQDSIQTQINNTYNPSSEVSGNSFPWSSNIVTANTTSNVVSNTVTANT